MCRQCLSSRLHTLMMSNLPAVASDGLFSALLLIIVAILYRNSLYGGFIWDDRAAVVRCPARAIFGADACLLLTHSFFLQVKNDDVHGLTSFNSLFVHDFWGTDITRNDSHKSYRPLTVATFRLDFSFHELDAFGYHLSNIIVYAVTCLLVYAVISQWLSVKGNYIAAWQQFLSSLTLYRLQYCTGARIAALLFVFHPVHVEAVASIVGRADALCGLFYCAALYSYTLGVRMSLINPRAVLTIFMLGTFTLKVF